ncbi:MAG: hypothetical protein WDW38_008055 [Sanguina aurantia]
MDMLLNCCTEFVQLLSSEANDVCTKQGKKSVNPEHVLSALTALGFDAFVAEARQTSEQSHAEAKSVSTHKAAKRKTGADQAGLTEQEQIDMQQKMFADARAQSMTTHESAAAMRQIYEQQLASSGLLNPQDPGGSSVPQQGSGTSRPEESEAAGQQHPPDASSSRAAPAARKSKTARVLESDEEVDDEESDMGDLSGGD